MTDLGDTSQTSQLDESASLDGDTGYIADPGPTTDITDTTELARRLQDQETELARLRTAIEAQHGKTPTTSSSHSESQLSRLQDFIRACLAEEPNSVPAKPVDKFKAAISKNLQSETTKKEEDGFADPLPEPCVHALDLWFRRIHPGAEISELLKLCEFPRDCPPLKQVVINDEVKKKMDKQDLVSDQRLKWLSNGLLHAAGPLSSAWCQLMQLEFAIRGRDPTFNETLEDDEVDFSPPDAFVPLDKDTDLNLSEIIRKLKVGLKMVGYCHVQAVQKRRLDLKDLLNGSAKELADPSQPFDDTIFGPDLNKHLNQIVAANKVAQKICGTPSNRRGRRYHPFLGQSPRGQMKRQHSGRGYNNNQAVPPLIPYPWIVSPPRGNWYQQPSNQGGSNKNKPKRTNLRHQHSNRGRGGSRK